MHNFTLRNTSFLLVLSVLLLVAHGAHAQDHPPVIVSADFLTKEQKRDIFYSNAARFLRLSEEEIARHHGM